MRTTCPQCHEPIGATDRFCASCGAKLGEAPAGGSFAVASGPAMAGVAADDGIHRLGVVPDLTPRRRRRRRRRPLYKRPLVMVPLILLLMAVTGFGVLSYRVGSMLSSLHMVSTPPPMVTDATFLEEDDPDMPGGPIAVDTGPARAAIAQTAPEASQRGGLTSRLQKAVSSSGDLVGGAAVAAGLKGGGEQPLTLLVMGVDARSGAAIDIGVRPDALMVVRLDPATETCRVLSVPRDTRVELPGYGQSKINHALMVGGIPYQIMVTEDYLDIEIDHYVLIDFVAFEQMVDAVGGVSVTVPEDLAKNGEVKFTKGTHHFDGTDALAYTRYRAPSTQGDLGRVERQWSLLGGLASAVQGRDIVGDVNRMMPALEAHMRTDMTATDMTDIAKRFGSRCTSARTRSIEMLNGSRVKMHDPILDQVVYYNIVDGDTVRNRVDALLHGDGTPAGTPAQPPATPVPSPQASPTAGGAGHESSRRGRGTTT